MIFNIRQPFFWIPLSDVYGRRPIVLLCLLTTIVGGIASATATSFGSLAGARGVAGMGFGGLMTVGTLVVNDLFFLHERGQKTGIYTLFVTNGAHVAFISTYAPLLPTPIANLLKSVAT